MDDFRFLVEHAPDGVVILVAGKIAFINPVAIRLLGADPDRVIGTPILAYLPPEDARLTMERIGHMMRTGQEIPPNEYRVLADPQRVVEIKSMPCTWGGDRAVIAYARDVTERKHVQDQLVSADRFAALGKLAASVAHEINNPLTYARASLELVALKLSARGIADLDPLLTDAMHGIDRVATVTKDLRTFARPDLSPSGPTDLVAAIEQSLRMVDNELRHRARCTRQFADDLPPVHGSSARLEQVVVNLLLNAIHALESPETDEIRISVETEGQQVVLRVTDTGRGIAEVDLARVFDPFFTTKPAGIGMGLGLYVCKNLVETDGGSIEIGPASPHGTTVTVTLRAATRIAQPAIAAPAPTTRCRVMIVDDEPFIRDTLATLLAEHHDVSCADSAEAALELLRNPLVDVIVSDVMMPRIDGIELYRRIAVRHPGLERRIIFMTGGHLPELAAFLATAQTRCLPKPFTVEQLLAAIGQVAA